MANWKEVAFKDDLTVLAAQSANATEGDIAIGSSTTAGEVVWTPMADHTILAGDNSDAKVVAVGGDLDLDSSDGLEAKFTLKNGAVDTLALADGTITIDKISDISVSGTLHDVLDAGAILYWDENGNPKALPGPTSASQRLGSVSATPTVGGTEYVPQWESITATATIDVSEANDGAKPVVYASDIDGSATLHGDLSPSGTDEDFTYAADTGTLNVHNLTVKDQINGTIATAQNDIVVAGTNATSSIAMYDAATGTMQAKTHAGLTYDASGDGLLTVANLNVSGTTTTVNTDDLIVQDNTITLAVPSNASTGTVALGAKSGIVISTNGLGGDGDDTSTDVTFNPRFIWNATSTTIDGSEGTAINAGTAGGPAATTLGWAIAGAGKANPSDSTSTAASTLYNLAPMVVFGDTYVGSGGASAAPIDDIGIGAQYLTNQGTNGADSRLFIQVD